jgi:hypothetical protein
MSKATLLGGRREFPLQEADILPVNHLERTDIKQVDIRLLEGRKLSLLR